MNLYFTPTSMFASYSLAVAGDSIVIDGQPHALSALAALGDHDPRPPFVVSATESSVTLMLPYWGEASDAVLYPEPLLDVPDGPVQLPA
jgi:hypothetical protein